jgi:DNA-binding transcriptional LysR family regulator
MPTLLSQLAFEGAGICAVANFFAEPYVQHGELRRLLPQWCLPPGVAWAVFPGRRLMPAKTRAFLDALTGVLSTSPEVEARCIEEERRRRSAREALAEPAAAG